MRKTVLLAAVPLICTGCAAANFFAITNNVTGTIVNTGIIAAVVGLLSNLTNITQLIQGLAIGG